MNDYTDGPAADPLEVDEPSEAPDPPRQVRGLVWLFGPGVAGAALGTAWSAYYAALRGVDPLTPVLVGGGVGLGLGAFLWVFFPYKGGRRPTHSPKRGPS